MSEMSDIYDALTQARFAVEALESWQQNAGGRDIVRGRRQSIEQGLRAYERLSAQLRDGRKHVEVPDDFKPTSCMCSWPTVSPPCSWCTDPANGEEEVDA